MIEALLIWPFVVVVVAVLPWLAWRSRRILAEEGAGIPKGAMYLQVFAVQLVVAGLAWIAARGGGVGLSVGRFGMREALLAGGFVVLAIAASAWARSVRDGPNELVRILSPSRPIEWVWWVSAVSLAAVVEEYAYRGVLFSLVSEVFPGWLVPASLSAICFGVSHLAQGWTGALVSAVFGVGLQALVLAGDGLAAAVIAHLVYNLGADLLARRDRAGD